MKIYDLFAGIRDLFDSRAIASDMRHVAAGLRDHVEGLWNEKAVLNRNGCEPPDRVPTSGELSYRN